MGDPVADFFLDNPQKLDDPFADLAWLREHQPVHRHEASGQWFVFPYDEVRALFGDDRLSADRIAGFADAAPASVRDELMALVPYLETWLIFATAESIRDFAPSCTEGSTRTPSNRSAARSSKRRTGCWIARSIRAGSMSPPTTASCFRCTCWRISWAFPLPITTAWCSGRSISWTSSTSSRSPRTQRGE